jgi:hypothetical protein
MTKTSVALLCFLSCVVASCGASTSTPTAESAILIEEKQINSYSIVIRRDSSTYLDTVTIEKDGQVKFQSAPWSHYEIIDIQNDGQPEIIVWQYDGGNHGTFQIQGFNTGTNLTKILNTPPTMCEGEFKDLNGDGIVEFRTCDHTFVYYNSRCSYASSPFVNAIFQYQPQKGYQISNLDFLEIYSEAISIHTKRIQDFQTNPTWSKETLREEIQCNILPLVLDYLYSGQSDKAWQVLDEHYQFEDVNDFRQDIEKRIHESPFFVSQ